MMPFSPISSITDGFKDGYGGLVNATESTDDMADNTSDRTPWFEYESSSSRILENYITLPLFFVAVIGNSLILVVFSRDYYKYNLTAMLYRILAMADGLLVFILDGLHTLPFVTLGKSAYSHNIFTCKFAVFVVSWFRTFSVWVIVVLAFEKFICVWRPYHAKVINTKWNYGWLTLAILIVSCGLYVPLLITTGREDAVINGQLTGVCKLFGNRSIDWYHSIFFWMNLFACGILPFLCVFVANSVIIHSLKRPSSVEHSPTGSFGNTGESDRHRSNITTLLVISTTSVAFTLPDPIYLLMFTYNKDTESGAFHGLITFHFILPLFDALNRSINIVLFCIFGQKFRQNLNDIFLCAGQRNGWRHWQIRVGPLINVDLLWSQHG